MVLIHLAIGGVLKEACVMFGNVIIPPTAVRQEVVIRGIENSHPDAYVIQKLEKEEYIKVLTADNN